MAAYGGYVYFLTDPVHVHLYTGVTADLIRRVHSHLHQPAERSFVARKGLNKLVFFEIHDRIEAAIAREKQIKRWRRAKKDALVEMVNPEWCDLITDRGGEELMPVVRDLPVDVETLEWR